MGNFSDDRGDHDQALKMYKEALQLERDIGNESVQATCLNNIGSVYSEKNQFEDALTYFQQALQLREKSKVPQDIAEAVHNLGQTQASMGQYDQAITYYMRALDLRRSINDTHGAALDSYGLGALFDYQGRFGAAINAKQDALKTLRDLKDGSPWMPEILGSYGESLILAGRGDEAKGPLDEALRLAHDLKNDGLVAQTLGFQGDAFFYQGNFTAAHSLYDQALQTATRSKDGEQILLAKIGLAKVEIHEKSGRQAIPNLRALIQQAGDLGLKYSSVESSIFMAEAMMQSHDNPHARQELQRALLLADKFGQQPLSAQAHYLLATMARESADNTEAQDHYRSVLRTLDTMKKEPGAEKLLQRSDLKLMYDESAHWSQVGKS
jgi:tetratricopeptide (TPR) repeat protein